MPEVKLTPIQIKAYQRLVEHGSWISSYDIRFSTSTMDALCRKKMALRRGAGQLGAIFSPQTTIEYKAIEYKARLQKQ